LLKLIKSIGATAVGRFFFEQIVYASMNSKLEINHNDVKMLFTSPNSLTRYRSKSFSNKEPETLTWIETMPEDAIFWDVGANVCVFLLDATFKESFLERFDFLVYNIYFCTNKIRFLFEYLIANILFLNSFLN